jgi:hypothetical protein
MAPRRSRSKQIAQRNSRIMFAIFAVLLVAAMVLSLVVSTAPITPTQPTPTIQQSMPLPLVTP